MQLKTLNKRGTHIGVVLSFVIFMTFIFFIFIITQPALKTERKDNSLEYLATSLAKEASENLTTVSLVILQPAAQNCVRFSGFFNVAGVGNKIVVRNSSDVLQAQIDGNDLLVVRNNGEMFFKVYDSGEFNATATGPINPCQQLVQGNDYSFGLVKTEGSVFQTKITKLIGNYSSDYSGLKNQLKISQENEFDFSFTYSNGTNMATAGQNKTISSNINIYAKSIPTVYISDKAAEESGLLNVKIW